MSRRDWSRRRFLRGLGGAAMGLPFLESLGWRRGVRAEPVERPIYSVFMRQANGVAQAYQDELYDEPERFWPRALGPLTKEALLGRDSDRAISELADFAHRLLLVKGCDHPFPRQFCGHAGAGAMCLTGANYVGFFGNDVLAKGMSIDTRISQELTPTIEPLTLMAGRTDGFLGAVLSYRGPLDRRAPQTDPYNVYLDLFSGGAGFSREALESLMLRRKSVNDLVREELSALLREDLGGQDRIRLERHLDSVRDIEVALSCNGNTLDLLSVIEGIEGEHDANANLENVTQLHCKLIALSFTCDLRRTATLQVGGGQDGTRFIINGNIQPSWHHISHRKSSDDVFADVPSIENAAMLHHEIDRIHARLFKYLLELLDNEVTLAGTNMLDDSVAVWTNELGTGPNHGHTSLPHVVAGSGGGFLRQGVFVDAGGGVPNNHFLSTLLNAVGVRKADGSLVDDFGDPSIDPGVIAAMIA
jgi:hypothetical protein